MPYGRSNYRRRRPYSNDPATQRRYMKKKGRLQTARKMTGTEPNTIVDKIASGIGTVATIARSVSAIASLINVEDKYVDTALSASVTLVSPYAVVLNQIAQGAAVNQRNGNKVLSKCLQVNFRIYLDATAAATATNSVRMVVLIDKKPQIGALTWNTVYNPNDDVSALVDKDTAGDRVVILKDRRWTLNGSDKRLHFGKFYIPLTRIHAQYTGSAATAYEANAIYLLAISDVTGAQPAVVLNGNARYCYLDN